MKLESIIHNDRYDTPLDTPHLWGDKFFLKTRLYMQLRYMLLVAHGGWLARRGVYDAAAWWKTSCQVVKLIEGCGGRFHICGLDNLKTPDGPLVLVSNHMSNLESSVFPCLILPFRRMTFVVKASLLHYPFFGTLLKAQNPIAVSRTNPRADFQKVMDEGSALLEQGISVLIYPEGTRAEQFDPDAFNTLGVKLARKAHVPIMPIAVQTDWWSNGRVFRDFGPLRRDRPIHFTFGRPLEVTGTGRQTHEQILAFIGGALEERLATGD